MIYWQTDIAKTKPNLCSVYTRLDRLGGASAADACQPGKKGCNENWYISRVSVRAKWKYICFSAKAVITCVTFAHVIYDMRRLSSNTPSSMGDGPATSIRCNVCFGVANETNLWRACKLQHFVRPLYGTRPRIHQMCFVSPDLLCSIRLFGFILHRE